LLIELEGIKDVQTVFLDNILLKLKVSGMNEIESVSIDHNDNQISGTSSYSKKHSIGKQYYINLNVQLIDGENRFTIKVNDDQQQAEKTVVIHKKKLEIDDVNMTIAMIPVKDKPFKPDLETFLLESFSQTKFMAAQSEHPRNRLNFLNRPNVLKTNHSRIIPRQIIHFIPHQHIKRIGAA
jgi:hypothetical protein